MSAANVRCLLSAILLSARLCPAVLLVLVLLVASASAQTAVSTSWLGGDGYWNDPINWSIGTVPNNNSVYLYNVSINPSSTSTVNHYGSDETVFASTISTLQLGTQATLGISSASLSVLGNFNNGGRTGVGPGGSLSAGALDNSGYVDLGFGSLRVDGRIDNSGAIYGAGTLSAGVLNNAGTFYLAEFGGGLTTGTITNSGSLGLCEGGARVDGNLVNSGSVELNYAVSLAATGDVINSGSISVGTGWPSGLVTAGNLNNSGSLYLATAGGLSVSGSLKNDGMLDLNSLYGSVIGGDFNNSGSFLSSEATSISLGIPGYGSNVNLGIGGAIRNSGSMQMFQDLHGASFDQDKSGYWLEQFSSATQYGRGFGTLDVAGAIWLDGTLDFRFLGGFTPALGTTFEIADFQPGYLHGSFSSILNNSFNDGQSMFQINYDNGAGKVLLTVVPSGSQEVIFTPEPACWELLVSAVSVIVFARRRHAKRLLAPLRWPRLKT